MNTSVYVLKMFRLFLAGFIRNLELKSLNEVSLSCIPNPEHKVQFVVLVI